MRYSIRKLFEAHLDIDKFTDKDDDGEEHGDWSGQMSKPRKEPVPTTGQKSAVSDKKLSWNEVKTKFPDFTDYFMNTLEHESYPPDTSEWVFIDKGGILWAEATGDDPQWYWDADDQELVEP